MMSGKDDVSVMVPLDDTEDVPFGDEGSQKKKTGVIHPVAVFFHMFFRVIAIVVYILCEWFSSSFIANFVSVIVLLSLDFWTTKNITGRLLVGLRWWNHVTDEGKSIWIYESKKGKSQNSISAAESRLFWLSIVVCQVVWSVLVILAIVRLNLKWLIISFIGFLMNAANLYGYIRCKFGSNEKLGKAASTFLGQQVLRGMFSSKPKATTSET